MNEKIDSFLDRLKQDEGVLGVILFGSWARGNNRLDSDVDLLVIKKAGFLRTVEMYEDTPFEITYTTEEGVKKYWADNPDDCVELWKTGKIIFDRTGILEKLKQFAVEIESKSKKPLSDDAIKHTQFDVYDQIKAVTRLKETDTATASMIIQAKVFQLCEKYFDLRQIWTPPTKQRLQALQENDPSLAEKVRVFYNSTDLNNKIELATEIANLVFQV
jgi:predicted nucleotidyltransferase